MEQELAYSFHLGSDKNKSKLAKKVAKENLSSTTSLANNAIQNAKDLSDVNRTTLINFGKYKLVMFAMAKLMEMETKEQNKVALYLFNRMNLKKYCNM